MTGRYDRDKLFIALQRYGGGYKAQEILTQVDAKGFHDFTIDFLIALKLKRQFNYQHKLYHVSTSREDRAGNWVVVHVVSKCVQPGAPWVKCVVCETPVKTCNKIPCCPVHPHGAELKDVHVGKWVCSSNCWEIRRLVLETES